VKKTNRCVWSRKPGRWLDGLRHCGSIMTHAFDYLDAPVAAGHGKDVPMPYAANLEKLALPSRAEVIEAAKGRNLR
jgi:pyruvate dehydrogenase E1 component beta subunit